MKAPSSAPLGRNPQSPLQLSHFIARPTAAGVVRSGHAGHSLTLTRSDYVTTAGTYPSRRVVLHGIRSESSRLRLRYCDPLALPLCGASILPTAYTQHLAMTGLHRRAFRVPHSSLHACCSPYPAGTQRTIRFQCAECRLRRDMSGSAPGLFIYRGCKLHFMLRPACLLPPLRGFEHPASDTQISPPAWGLLPGAPALTGTGLSPAGEMRRASSISRPKRLETSDAHVAPSA
jgi:hypothetical protein